MEAEVLDATRKGSVEGIVLRFGGFYGPNAGIEVMATLLRRRWLPVIKRTNNSVIPLIHIEDAAAVVVAALNRGRAGHVYNVVDDEPASCADVARYLASSIAAPQPPTVPMSGLRIIAPYAATTWLAQPRMFPMRRQNRSFNGSRALQPIAPGCGKPFAMVNAGALNSTRENESN